jgi:hypothetical protein
MLSGLKAFLKDYPAGKAYFVYGGKRRMYQDEIEIIPIEELLKELPAILSRK